MFINVSHLEALPVEASGRLMLIDKDVFGLDSMCDSSEL